MGNGMGNPKKGLKPLKMQEKKGDWQHCHCEAGGLNPTQDLRAPRCGACGKSHTVGFPIYYFQISGSGIMINNKAKTLDNPERYQPLAQPAIMGKRQFSNCQSLPIHDPDVSKPPKRAFKFFLSHLQNIA